MHPGKTGKTENARRLLARMAVALAVAAIVTGGIWTTRGGVDQTQYLGEVIWGFAVNVP